VVAIISVIDKIERRIGVVVDVKIVRIVTFAKVTEKFGELQSKMGDFSDHIKSEDTSATLDLPSLNEDADNADDVDFDEALIPTIAEKKSAEILIEIDQDRKKVITLSDGGYDSLVELFFEAVAEDPGLTEYANSTFIFQIYSQKFNTWVDLDRSKELIDGSHLKAIFLTQTKLDTEPKHKCGKTSKRRLADSSDNCSDHNCKSKTCSSDDSVRAKRICETVKTCVADAEKNSVTSLLIRSHGLIDNSWNKQVLESHLVLPASEGLYHQLLMLTKSCKNCRFTSEGTLFMTYLKIHIFTAFCFE
jgi:hypothetical protein